MLIFNNFFEKKWLRKMAAARVKLHACGSPVLISFLSGEQVMPAPRLRRDAGEELLAAAHGAAARPRAGGSPRTATARRARGSSRPSPARDVGVLDVQRARAPQASHALTNPHPAAASSALQGTAECLKQPPAKDKETLSTPLCQGPQSLLPHDSHALLTGFLCLSD